MTAPGHLGRALADPVGVIVDLIAAVEPRLETDRIRAVVISVAGGRAKSRRLAPGRASRRTDRRPLSRAQGRR